MSTQSNNPPTEDQLIIDSDLEAALFWEKNRKLIIGAAVAIVAAVVGAGLWYYNAQNEKASSEALFAEAKNPESWREVIAKYPRSISAANAYFLLAESQREQGNIDESNKTYQQFLSNFPQHSLVGGARLGLAENLALQGKVDQALESFRQIQGDQTSGYAASFAGLMEGQALIRQGKVAEARKIFLNTAQSDPSSPAGRLSGALGNQLTALLPPEVKPTTPAAPATPVASATP